MELSFLEVPLTDEVCEELIAFSLDWEAENSCYGYRANTRADLEGERIFLAKEGTQTVGYLFGHCSKAENCTSIIPTGTPVFEAEELYVIPQRRSEGIGQALVRFVTEAIRPEAEYFLLSTATKNWRKILHFYIDEVGMEFWSARLWMKL